VILDPESLAVRWYSQNLERIIGFDSTTNPGFYTQNPLVITHLIRLEFPHSSWIDIARQIEDHERLTVACTSTAPGTNVRLLATVHRGRDGLVIDLEPAGVPVLHNLHRLLETVLSSGSVDTLCQRVADTLQRSTGVDRVAILRTHAGGDHEVVAESCGDDQESSTRTGADWIDVASRFSGAGTRRSTALFDRRAVAVPLIATEQATHRHEPDLSSSALQVDANSAGRWTRDSAVRAAFVVAVHRESQPWGLIVFSHGSPLALHPADRALVETVAIAVGGQIRSLERQQWLDEAIAARARSETERNHTTRWVVEALDHLSEAVISFDLEGRVLSINRRMQELVQTTHGQTLIPGASVHEVDDKDELALLNRWLSDVPSQDLSPIEITRHDDAGLAHHYVCIARPVGLDPITAIVVTVRDVTEERNLQQKERALENRLMQAQQMEGLAVLAGGVAHDFNNLLVSIRCNAELVVSDARGLDEDMREALQDVIAASEVASDLTRQLLAYAGRGRGSVRRLDLVSLIRQLKPLARVASHRMEPLFECDETRVLITADPTQIRQIVLNVLVNAMEAVHPTEGRITVRVRRTHVAGLDRAALHFDAFKREESLAAIEIQDNGCGMDADTMARVLEPFFSTRFTGRGLGLAAVVGAVRVHNGGIAIASAPGEGTTMTIYLPALSAMESSEHLAAVTGSKHVILLGPVEELGDMASALEASVGVQTSILQSIQDVVNSRDALGAALKAAVIHHNSEMGRDLRAAQFLRTQSPDLMIIQLGGEREPVSGVVSVVMEKWSPAAVVRIVQERLNLERRLT
jgi:signal transduction histidine kinase